MRGDAELASSDRDGSGQPAARREDARSAPTIADPGTMTERDARLWGSLPAPWEPLPGIESGAREAGPMTAVASIHAAAPPLHLADTVHLAEQGRAQTGEDSSGGAPAAPAASAPPPDLDALARRVYDVLKRRLAAERRREG